MVNAQIKIDTKTRAYGFGLEIIKLVKKLDQKDLNNQILFRQIIRSATSVGANIVEAQAGRSKLDFGNFLSHALKSSNETCFWLQLLKDSQDLEHNKIEILLQECRELSNILAASVITLRKK
jgi:four helix bundle protein